VGGLPFTFTRDDIYLLFARFGEISDIRILHHAGSGKFKGVAFVDFTLPKAAASAINQLNGTFLQGRQIKVNYATNPIHIEKGDKRKRDKDHTSSDKSRKRTKTEDYKNTETKESSFDPNDSLLQSQSNSLYSQQDYSDPSQYAYDPSLQTSYSAADYSDQPEDPSLNPYQQQTTDSFNPSSANYYPEYPALKSDYDNGIGNYVANNNNNNYEVVDRTTPPANMLKQEYNFSSDKYYGDDSYSSRLEYNPTIPGLNGKFKKESTGQYRYFPGVNVEELDLESEISEDKLPLS